VTVRWLPVFVNNSDKQLAVMSLAFFLNTRNDAVIWRGPKKDSAYLVYIDCTGYTKNCSDMITKKNGYEIRC